MIFLKQPITNPAIPFVDSFVNDLQDGSLIIINGQIFPEARNFAINLSLGLHVVDTPDRSPIAFHFNPQLHQQYVARNTFQNGWGCEEITSPNRVFPFHRNQKFEIMILVTADSYMVSVEKKHFISYTHKIPYELVNTLEITGDITLHRVLLTTKSSLILESPSTTNTSFQRDFPEGLYRNCSILLTGETEDLTKNLTIDLLKGHYGNDVAFQMAVRFPDRFISFNNTVDIKEGQNFPFRLNSEFEVEIICKRGKLVVRINGNKFCKFRHWVNYPEIHRIRLTGDYLTVKLLQLVTCN